MVGKKKKGLAKGRSSLKLQRCRVYWLYPVVVQALDGGGGGGILFFY